MGSDTDQGPDHLGEYVDDDLPILQTLCKRRGLPPPTASRFIWPFLFALALAGCPNLAGMGVAGLLLAPFAVVAFPSGAAIAAAALAGIALEPPKWIALAGYAVYGLLIVLGIRFRSRAIWIAFIALLVLNVAGCQVAWYRFSKLNFS